ncbi:MAG: ATP-binding protein [Thermodesulfobacteriota bacterium]
MEPLSLPANLSALEEIGRYVKAAAEAAGLDPKAAYGLRLAVDEIATNIILHGYEEAGLTGNVDIAAELSPTALTVVLEDVGRPFDPRTRELPDEEELQKSLLERPIGGLGIYLVLNGVDRFDYQRTGERNRNIFIMDRPVS